ncbi:MULTISPECIES: acyltransferase family protein [Sphingobacterium]|uniref:acyltransferase family protein n=1 Tax=Sphingobacterium TaxID=28453 RepID=UPI0035E43750
MTLEKNGLKAFFIKRAARILPLLWLVSLKSIIFSSNTPNYFDIFLNLSGLFGFFKWDTYFATGAWSIGNELVFYAFFPFLLIAARKKNMLFWYIGAVILFISLYFSFYVLPDSMKQDTIFWRNYVNPLNQLIYFYSGIAIGRLFSMNKSISKASLWTVLIVSMLVFICYPTGANDALLVIKGNRYVFFIACWLIVASIYLIKANTNLFFHRPLLFLGEISYGIYLFHPIIYSLFKKSLDIFHISLPLYSFISLSAILSIVISYLSYRFFETKCVKIANRYLISCSNKI